MKQLVDPAENAFIERVRYYGNYWIFPGINYAPAHTLQGFLNVLYLSVLFFLLRIVLVCDFIIAYFSGRVNFHPPPFSNQNATFPPHKICNKIRIRSKSACKTARNLL
jgi:hypothetical protein